ncbi:MAG: HlyC/CorC family transporter [Planctomycetota bacterium]|nr:MAG: HlyC/CorC family transporter [Planctomycetota bacterium]
MTQILPYLPGVLILLGLSGFFSGSEAAFFSITPLQRKQLLEQGGTGRLAARLLEDSERLLMGILFWNLAINLAYFSLVSQIALHSAETLRSEAAGVAFSIGGVVLIVVTGEFLPKSIAISFPLAMARAAAIPLAFMLRVVGFALPPLKFVTEISRRIIWPGFRAEAYLELSDLDRAVELSTDEAQLVADEAMLLRNVIQLTGIRVEEWMRPRLQFRMFPPSVQLSDLGGRPTPSGYILVTDAQGKEIEGYIRLAEVTSDKDLKQRIQPVLVIPWCASVADALSQMRDSGRRVAIVVNEYGETIGILTWEDAIEAILQAASSRTAPELSKAEIVPLGTGSWQATGMTKLRRLERVLGRPINRGGSLTIAGALQEQLHRLPEEGDVCELDGLRIEVIKANDRGKILVRIDTQPDPQRPPESVSEAPTS